MQAFVLYSDVLFSFNFIMLILFYIYLCLYIFIAGLKVKTEPGFDDSDSDDSAIQGKLSAA